MRREAMFDLLTRIERRPEMYVGGSRSERGEQLRNLTWVLFGYQLALKDAHPDWRGDFLRDFGEYLVGRYSCSGARGPVAAIRDIAADDHEAWSMFWKSVAEYKKSTANS